MRLYMFLLAALVSVSTTPATAATLDEILAMCAPADKGGRAKLCDAYLDAGLELLASPDPMLNGGTRVCVPAGEDRGQILDLLRDYARDHPESLPLSGRDGLGLALKGRFSCK